MISVERPNGEQTPKEQADTLDKALATLERAANATGCQLLLPTKASGTQYSTGSTSYVTIPGYNFAIQASGGVVEIEGTFNASIDTAGEAAMVALFLDGKDILSKGLRANGSELRGCLALKYKAVLEVGPHVVEFKYKASGGLAYINLALATGFQPTSEVTISETAAP